MLQYIVRVLQYIILAFFALSHSVELTEGDLANIRNMHALPHGKKLRRKLPDDIYGLIARSTLPAVIECPGKGERSRRDFKFMFSQVLLEDITDGRDRRMDCIC